VKDNGQREGRCYYSTGEGLSTNNNQKVVHCIIQALSNCFILLEIKMQLYNHDSEEMHLAAVDSRAEPENGELAIHENSALDFFDGFTTNSDLDFDGFTADDLC
jgi:hypothetical protein